MTNNYELIARAIREKLQIIAVYQGHYREMCPHALGKKKVGSKRCFINSEEAAVKVR